MKAVPVRIFLILFIFVLIYPSVLPAATERRTALVIGNGAYSSGLLRNPVNDADAMATQLLKLGFSVILKKNADLQTMEEAMGEFGYQLRRGGVGLFFYAGHGLQVNGVNYLVPVAAKINRESDVKYEAMDVGKILDEMAYANNGLNIVILDACRDNPFTRNFRNTARGLAIVSNAPTGTLISYSTGPGDVARDGDSLHSPYTQALLKYMKEPGLSVEHMFKKVRATLSRQTGGKQIPWELSSLQGDFFFVPGTVEIKSTRDVSDEEQQRLEAKRRLGQEQAALASQKDLDEKRRQIDEELERLKAMTTTLAMGVRPALSTAKEIGRDGRFIAYENGTVMDTKTNLMWAAKDNGNLIDWANAKSYCENYRLGGYTDWRMPTQDELKSLYESGIEGQKRSEQGCNQNLTKFIKLSNCNCWASDGVYGGLSFDNGRPTNNILSADSRTAIYHQGVLPVRSVK